MSKGSRTIAIWMHEKKRYLGWGISSGDASRFMDPETEVRPRNRQPPGRETACLLDKDLSPPWMTGRHANAGRQDTYYQIKCPGEARSPSHSQDVRSPAHRRKEMEKFRAIYIGTRWITRLRTIAAVYREGICCASERFLFLFSPAEDLRFNDSQHATVSLSLSG